MLERERLSKTLPKQLAIVLKGYPRLSETFIAQEILSLERTGLQLTIISLRKPTDRLRHPINLEIKANLLYLPEYLLREPIRVFKAWYKVRSAPNYRNARRIWLEDLKRDFSTNRIRRWGQALVLVAELDPEIRWLYAHFLHTPASVSYYSALISDRTWSVSAHAKDIWLTPDWEKREKLNSCAWAVTCTKFGLQHLDAIVPGKTQLSYHGLDLTSLPSVFPTRKNKPTILGFDPICLLSVGRAVPKKGFDVLLKALSTLPSDMNWRWTHIGAGKELKRLKKSADLLKISDKIIWMGPRSQRDVFNEYGKADLFILPSIVAPDGDRDGLPNVLMEAASQKLCCIATNISALAEFIEHNKTGWLVTSGDVTALRDSIIKLALDPDLRLRLGVEGYKLLKYHFSHSKSMETITDLLSQNRPIDAQHIRDQA